MAAISRRVCTAAAEAIRALGAEAEFRAPTDIVVAGRKIPARRRAGRRCAALTKHAARRLRRGVMLRALAATAPRVTPEFLAGARQSW